jgi:hypothetical protein
VVKKEESSFCLGLKRLKNGAYLIKETKQTIRNAYLF